MFLHNYVTIFLHHHLLETQESWSLPGGVDPEPTAPLKQMMPWVGVIVQKWFLKKTYDGHDVLIVGEIHHPLTVH